MSVSWVLSNSDGDIWNNENYFCLDKVIIPPASVGRTIEHTRTRWATLRLIVFAIRFRFEARILKVFSSSRPKLSDSFESINDRTTIIGQRWTFRCAFNQHNLGIGKEDLARTWCTAVCWTRVDWNLTKRPNYFIGLNIWLSCATRYGYVATAQQHKCVLLNCLKASPPGDLPYVTNTARLLSHEKHVLRCKRVTAQLSTLRKASAVLTHYAAGRSC